MVENAKLERKGLSLSLSPSLSVNLSLELHLLEQARGSEGRREGVERG